MKPKFGCPLLREVARFLCRSAHVWQRSQCAPGTVKLEGLTFGEVAKFAIVTMLLIVTAISCGATSTLTPESRKDLELQPGVVLIVVSFEAKLGPFQCDPAVSGTGFLYRPDGYLLTNGHVVQMARINDDGAKEAKEKAAIPCLTEKAIKSRMTDLGRQLSAEEMQSVKLELVQAIVAHQMVIGEGSLTVYLDNFSTGEGYSGEIKAYSAPIDEKGKDIAVVKINGNSLPTVQLGNSDEVSVGEEMTVIGYPGAATNATFGGLFSNRSLLVPTVTNGRISAVNKTLPDGTPALQSEATINPGNSGGPAFDEKGRVIGIATYTLTNASGLNFFVPVNTAMEFVHQAGADPQRGIFDHQWHAALDAYANEDWTDAHEKLSSVLEIMPNQPDALNLQKQAKIGAERESFIHVHKGLVKPAAIGFGVVLLLIVAIVAFSQSIKRDPRPTHSVNHPVEADRSFSSPHQIEVPAPVRAVPEQSTSFGSLHVTNGPLAGNRFAIPKSGLLIGRDPSKCAVVLANESVGREHAWVVPLDNGVVVIDRDSTNGTYINSVDSPRVSKMLLKDGDRIFIGNKSPTQITFVSL